MSNPRYNLIQLMNHVLTSNHLLGSICINLLDHLELCLDLQPFLPHKENRPLSYRKSLVKADIDILKVKSSCVQPAFSLTNLFIAFLIAFFCKISFALLPPDGKSANLKVVFSYKPPTKQAVWLWLCKICKTFALKKTSANI